MLDDAINNLPSTGEKPLNEMTEEDVTKWLKKLDSYKQGRNKKFSIDVPKLVVTDRLGSKRTDEEVLPLFLEDNSTIAGTISILTELRQKFNLPEDQYGPEYLPVDKHQNGL